MKVETTFIDGLLILEPTVYEDNRGFFFETYKEETLRNLDVDAIFVRDKQERLKYGTFINYEYQKEPYEQARLVRVLKGDINCFVVDLRINSPTFKANYEIILSSENNKQLYIPRGFAHGLGILSEYADVFIKYDNYFSKEHVNYIRIEDVHS